MTVVKASKHVGNKKTYSFGYFQVGSLLIILKMNSELVKLNIAMGK